MGSNNNYNNYNNYNNHNNHNHINHNNTQQQQMTNGVPHKELWLTEMGNVKDIAHFWRRVAQISILVRRKVIHRRWFTWVSRMEIYKQILNLQPIERMSTSNRCTCR